MVANLVQSALDRHHCKLFAQKKKKKEEGYQGMRGTHDPSTCQPQNK